jgi:ABC-type glycerol-3-phosphate transport system substrate-binding protein
MKPRKIKMLAMSVAIAVLAACVSSASAGQDSTANSDPALATAEAFVTAPNNADLDALVGTFAEDATVFLPFSSGPARAGLGRGPAIHAK